MMNESASGVWVLYKIGSHTISQEQSTVCLLYAPIST